MTDPNIIFEENNEIENIDHEIELVDLDEFLNNNPLPSIAKDCHRTLSNFTIEIDGVPAEFSQRFSSVLVKLAKAFQDNEINGPIRYKVMCKIISYYIQFNFDDNSIDSSRHTFILSLESIVGDNKQLKIFSNKLKTLFAKNETSSSADEQENILQKIKAQPVLTTVHNVFSSYLQEFTFPNYQLLLEAVGFFNIIPSEQPHSDTIHVISIRQENLSETENMSETDVSLFKENSEEKLILKYNKQKEFQGGSLYSRKPLVIDVQTKQGEQRSYPSQLRYEHTYPISSQGIFDDNHQSGKTAYYYNDQMLYIPKDIENGLDELSEEDNPFIGVVRDEIHRMLNPEVVAELKAVKTTNKDYRAENDITRPARHKFPCRTIVQTGASSAILTIGVSLVFGGLFTAAFALAHGNIPLALIGVAAVVTGAVLASFGTNRLLKASPKMTDQILNKTQGGLHTLTSCASSLFGCNAQKVQSTNKKEDERSVRGIDIAI